MRLPPPGTLLLRTHLIAAAALILGAWALSACSPTEGCLAGDDGTCVPPPACTELVYACDDPFVQVRTLLTEDQRPPGLDALAAAGDLVLENDRLVLVIDALDAPHYLAPSGGTIIDLVSKHGGATDSLHQILQTIGILPDDAAAYHTLEILDRAPDHVAVVARGQLDGYPAVDVVTRYELRPCEPGVRVRTELFHGGLDPITVFLSDVYYWGDRQMTPFVPLPGQGFEHPDLDLLTIDDSFRSFPWMAAQDHTAGGSAYGVLPCGRTSLDGFHAAQVSTAGFPRTPLQPGDGLVLERFVLTGAGPGLGAVINNVMPARQSLYGERFVHVTGTARDADGAPVGGDERFGSLLFYEPASGADPDDPAGRRPVAEVVPAADGTFLVRLPARRDLRVERWAFGRAIPGSVPLTTGDADAAMDPIDLPSAGLVAATVSDASGAPLIAEIVLTPAGATAASDVDGSIYGWFDDADCAPFLGPPHGDSPACNRALVGPSGALTFAAPAGTYYAYAVHGPFWTLARAQIEVVPGQEVALDLTLEPLPGLLPEGVLSGDFHVHAGASFDSSMPERDRALTFVSQGVDVIAATDHDVVTDYAAAIAELGIGEQVRVMPGVETTGHILFWRPPGSTVPKVVGHFNFWPLEYDALAAYNGGLDDERVEPGVLFDVIDARTEGRAVRQLNHPFAESLFGRDEGFLAAVDYDPRVAVPAQPSNTPEGQLARRPGGGLSNLDHHVQEVMNGSSTHGFLKYRAAWFSLLNQGIVRGGTANSDSHTLAVEVLGSPRTLVFAGMTHQTFERDAFNEHIKQGHMVGTNGPVLLASVEGADGAAVGPSTAAFEPAAGASLHIEVRAAPWIPVHEVRVVVNGVVATTLGVPEALQVPADPFGTGDLVRLEADVALADVLPASGDAWIVVEAGRPLVAAADLDDDGLADTTDNNGDGVIDDFDHAAVQDDEDEFYQEPARPDLDAAGFHQWVAAPGTWTTSFTNPFLVDRSGDGWTAPGLGAGMEAQ